MTRTVMVAVVAGLLALGGAPARAGAPPYRLPAPLPDTVASPPVDRAAPYTPLVRSLVKQLLPDDTPTLPEVQNAAKLLQGYISATQPQNPSCHGVGSVAAPTGTKPSIAPLCWADAVGINHVSGPNAGKTSATAE